jgi:multimeric flavodoxin WrbA
MEKPENMQRRRRYMKYAVLMGSPRKTGNTFALLKPFMETLAGSGATCSLTWLYDKKISGCTACRACQRDWTKFGCIIQDDMQFVFDEILSADVLVFATPIYSWFCTAPMKAVLDRLVYGMNKYYGEQKGPALWAGKQAALLLTCGYRPENGVDLFVEGMRRYCKHSQLRYVGMHAERDLGYNAVFIEEAKIERTIAFAGDLLAKTS